MWGVCKEGLLVFGNSIFPLIKLHLHCGSSISVGYTRRLLVGLLAFSSVKVRRDTVSIFPLLLYNDKSRSNWSQFHSRFCPVFRSNSILLIDCRLRHNGITLGWPEGEKN